MEIRYNITGGERKGFVKAVSEIMGEPSKYLGMPSCAYAIGSLYTVTKDGNLEIADDVPTNKTAWLMAKLEEHGYTAEPTDEIELIIEGTDEGADEQEGFSIGMHMTELSEKPFSEDTLEKLRAIIAGHKSLFQKSLGTESDLKTKWEENNLWFDWFDHMISREQVEMYGTFFRALYKFAENAKRVNETHKQIENEKFAMRTFLNRIGLSGPEHKPLRKELLKNLSGSSAFRYGRPKKNND